MKHIFLARCRVSILTVWNAEADQTTVLHPPARPRLILYADTDASVSGQHGFTLLEVLVAFFIAFLALALLFRSSGESMHAVASALRHEEAISRAQSHLDAAGVNLSIRDQDGGDGGGFRWRLRVRQVDTFKVQNQAVALYAITVRITWHEGGGPREVRLQSSRLGTAASSS